MKAFLTKFYIISFMSLTIFFIVVIWNLTIGKLITHWSGDETEHVETVEQKQVDETEYSFKKIILESDETVKHYLGYRVLEEMKIEGHFHHIDYDMEPDNRSYCVECHGDIPHDQKPEMRAFANMHSAFISCEACHFRLAEDQKTGVFKWYSRKTGEIIPSPIQEGVAPGLYHAKIIPFERVDAQLQRVDNPNRIAFAEDYRASERGLSDIQKAKAKKIIHKIVDPNPYLCEDCHRVENSLLPFEDLGYSKTRIDHLVSTEVVGMIRDYIKFYVPRMLHPGVSESEAGNSETQN